jgi:hypothetical protein
MLKTMPTTGYNNAQFYKIDAMGEYKYGTPRNKRFLYQSRGSSLQKGYIRALYGDTQSSTSSARKCSFQFNPAVISQSIQQSDATYDPLHVDPSEAARAGVASANFAFSIRFDRSMELNNVNPKATVATSTNYNIWEKNDPSQVGVLHDLAIFYSVIGQTFTTESLDALINYATLIQQGQAPANGGQGPAVPPTVPTSSSALSGLRSSGMLGNTAVLVPQPVRLVFSSLFMVDGYVQNTDVTFSKFNKAMVPMVVDVNVTMEAKYIGFARKTTPLTLIGSASQAAIADQQAQTVAEANAYYAAATSVAKTLEIGLAHSSYNTVEALLSNSNMEMKANLYVPNGKGGLNDAIGKLFADSFATTVQVGGAVTWYGPYTSRPGQGTTQASLKALTANKVPLLQVFLYNSDKNCTATTPEAWTKMIDSATSSGRTQRTPPGNRLTLSSIASSFFVVKYEANMTIRGTGINQLRGEGTQYVVYSGANSALDETEISYRVPLSWPKPSVASTTPSGSGKPGSTSQPGTGKTPTKPGVV